MRKIHYRNIGFPKTGTNWIWAQLYNHPQIDGRFDVAYKEFRGRDLSDYKKVYNNYNITYNLDTHIFTDNIKDYLRPEHIHQYTTHLTMIFRNPYEVLNSMYNMDKNLNTHLSIDKKEYTNIDCHRVKMYSDTKHIFEYWDNCKLPIKYMFYDDLQNDPKKFIYEICEHLGLKPFHNSKRGITFPTEKNNPLVFDNKDTIEYINRGISVIEDRLGRDLSHWKH